MPAKIRHIDGVRIKQTGRRRHSITEGRYGTPRQPVHDTQRSDVEAVTTLLQGETPFFEPAH